MFESDATKAKQILFQTENLQDNIMLKVQIIKN